MVLLERLTLVDRMFQPGQTLLMHLSRRLVPVPAEVELLLNVVHLTVMPVRLAGPE